MDKKTAILIGMVLGSYLGSYIVSLFGVGFFSFTSIVANFAGGLLGIWIAYKLF